MTYNNINDNLKTMKKIFWIASYPRSGNTWMRSILSSLFFTTDGKFDFNLLKRMGGMFEDAKRFEFVKNINEKDYKLLSDLKILSKYWLDSQFRMNTGSNFIFLKTHHACISYLNNNFTTPQITKGAIYLVRDPRDVAISYAKYTNKDIDYTIEIMCQKGLTVYYPAKRKELKKKYKAYISSWDDNVESWSCLNVPKKIIKYEDLLLDTENTLLKLINFLEEKFKLKFHNIDIKLKNVLETTNFKTLQHYEKKYGFKASRKKEKFFRQGRANQWKKILTKEQIKKIEYSFKDIMVKFGYI